MPVLATFVPVLSPNYAVPRQMFGHFALGWWSMSLLETGQSSLYQEHVFGGFYVRVTFTDYFWQWGSGSWRDPYKMFSDFYAMQPTDPTPINVGTVFYNPQFDNLTGLFILTFACDPSDGHYWVQQMPQQPLSYWLPQPANNPSLPFYVEP